MADLKTNVLYYGDNLDVLRTHIPDESVDLIYLDPPFNSNRNYNVLFKESSGASSDAQMEAFEDTWEWGPSAMAAEQDVMTGPRQDVARMLKAMIDGLTHNSVTAYLTMMTPRLIELHRILKPEGSMYLHCDPTVSHYLKVILDAIFGPTVFQNEIVWQRTSAHSDAAQGMRRFGRVHDTLLFYARSHQTAWNTQFTAYSGSHLDTTYRFVDEHGRRYSTADLTANKPGGDTSFEVTAPDGKKVKPYSGRYWAYSRENIETFIRQDRIHWRRTGMPRLKLYHDDMPGVSLQDVWTDIPPIGAGAKERLGYPTQKPQALLERIIKASSNPGDVILDPFCGCGTAVHAAQALGRRWIGIDITFLAIGLIRRRMQDAFPDVAIEEIGAPVDLGGAKALAEHDKYQFQWWALDRIGAQPVGGVKRKGADQGIDGVIPYFVGSGQGEGYRRAIVSVKGGGKSSRDVRDLVGVLKRENEPLGVFVTLEPETQPMRTEAASAGMWHSEFWDRDFPRVQILTVAEILQGKRPDLPPHGGASGFAKAPTEQERGEQLTLR